MCYENSEDDKNGNGDDENKQESKNREDYERNLGSGTAKNTEEPQRTPLVQSYISNISTTGIMNEWAMSMIEDTSATPRLPSLVRAWMESSNHGEDEKSRNMINVHLAREKCTIEHRSSNVSQPSVSHEEDEIQNSNFKYVPIKHPSEDPEEDDRKPADKRIK